MTDSNPPIDLEQIDSQLEDELENILDDMMDNITELINTYDQYVDDGLVDDEFLEDVGPFIEALRDSQLRLADMDETIH